MNHILMVLVLVALGLVYRSHCAYNITFYDQIQIITHHVDINHSLYTSYTSNTYDQTFDGNPPTPAILNTSYMVSISQSNLKLNKFQQAQQKLFSFKITFVKITTGISITIFGYCQDQWKFLSLKILYISGELNQYINILNKFYDYTGNTNISYIPSQSNALQLNYDINDSFPLASTHVSVIMTGLYIENTLDWFRNFIDISMKALVFQDSPPNKQVKVKIYNTQINIINKVTKLYWIGVFINQQKVKQDFGGQFRNQLVKFEQSSTASYNHTNSTGFYNQSTLFYGLNGFQNRRDQIHFTFQVTYPSLILMKNHNQAYIRAQIINFIILPCQNITEYYFIDNKTCYPTCPNETYETYTSFQCLSCSAPCKNCVLNSTQCTSCQDDNKTISNSTCIDKMVIQYEKAIKLKNTNLMEVYVKVYADLTDKTNLSAANWSQIFTIENNGEDKFIILSAQFDQNQMKIKITIEYHQDSNKKELLIKTNYDSIPQYAAMDTFNLTIALESSNSAPFHYYTPMEYKISQILEIICLILSLVSLLMFIAGFFGAKIIALEQIAIVQLTWICLATMKEPLITFESLEWLRFSFGYNTYESYKYVPKVRQNARMQQLYPNPEYNYLFSLIAIVLPLILACVIKIISYIKERSGIEHEFNWRKVLTENVYYGMMFSAYIIFGSFMMSIKLLSISSVEGQIDLITGGLIIITLITTVLVIYNRPVKKQLGQFRQKLKKYEISQYFYAFVFIQRAITVAIIFLTNSLYFGVPLAMTTIAIQLTFVIIQRPYIHGDFIRPVFCLSIELIILVLIFLANWMDDQHKKVTMVFWMPVIIVLLLIISFIVSIGYLVIELRQVYGEHQSKVDYKKAQEKINEQNNYEEDRYIQRYFSQTREMVNIKKNKDIKQFERKIYEDNQDLKTIFKSKICQVQNFNLNQEWQKYAELTSRGMHFDMGTIIGQKNKIQMENIEKQKEKEKEKQRLKQRERERECQE